MPRNAESIDALLASAVGDAISRVAPRIAKVIADAAATQLEAELQVRKSGRSRIPSVAAARSRARTEISRWVADRKARRVPNFVIELTGGLDTKKKIVAKFGEGVAFEKGKPLPKPKADVVKASDGKKVKEAAKVVAEK